MSSEEPEMAQPQGAWVSDVVRDLASDDAAGLRSPVATQTVAPPVGAGPADQATPAPHEQANLPVSRQAVTPPAQLEQRRPRGATEALRWQPDGSHTLFDEDAVTLRIRHGETPWQRVLRWVVGNARSAKHSGRLEDLVGAARRPITTGRRIGVTGVRGGVGTTTVCLLIAAVLAARRDDDVLAVDADPDLGSLQWRMRLYGGRTSEHLANDMGAASVSSRDQLMELVPRTEEGLWVLQGSTRSVPDSAPGGSDGSPGTTESPDSHGAVAPELSRQLARFFGVTVFDCGGAIVGGAAPDESLSSAHARVLVASATVDGFRALQLALAALRPGRRQADGDLNPYVVALVSHTAGRHGLDVGRALSALEAAGMQVVHLPYDRHLAAGARIDPTKLAEATVLAATDLAGRVLAMAAASKRLSGTQDGADSAASIR